MKLTAPQLAALRYYAEPAAERDSVDPVRPNTYRVLRRELLVIPAAGGPVLTPAGRDALTRATLSPEELAIIERRAAALDAMPTEEDDEPADGSAPGQDAGAVTDPHEVERLARSSEPGWGIAQRALVVDGVDHAEAEAERLAVLGGYGLPAARAQEAERPVHYTRERILDRFREVDSFVLHLQPDDRAYDPETGDTFLGGVSIRYARGEFPGPSYTATVLGEEPGPEVDDPRDAPRPVDPREVAEELCGCDRLRLPHAREAACETAEVRA